MKYISPEIKNKSIRVEIKNNDPQRVHKSITVYNTTQDEVLDMIKEQMTKLIGSVDPFAPRKSVSFTAYMNRSPERRKDARTISCKGTTVEEAYEYLVKYLESKAI